MEKRLLFPILMFTLAGLSFAFGGWQYMQSRSAQIASQRRMAFMVSSIEKSDISRASKRELYATITQGLPPAPAVFSFDFSGSFASVGVADACENEGQRTICRALMSESADVAIMNSVCGECKPQ
jgi:hypothetical protein